MGPCRCFICRDPYRRPPFSTCEESAMNTPIDTEYLPIPHNVETRSQRYDVGGSIYATEAAAFALAQARLRQFPNCEVTIKIIPPVVETLTLHPLRDAGWAVDAQPVVYLRVGPLRERNKIALIKMIRSLTGLGLKEAKDEVEGKEIISLGRMTVGQAGMLEESLKLTFHSPNLSYVTVPILYAEHV